MKQVIQNRAGATFVRDVPRPPCPPVNVLVRNEMSVISSGTERARAEGLKSIVSRMRERPELARKAVDRIRRDGIRNSQHRNQRDEGKCEMKIGGCRHR